MAQLPLSTMSECIRAFSLPTFCRAFSPLLILHCDTLWFIQFSLDSCDSSNSSLLSTKVPFNLPFTLVFLQFSYNLGLVPIQFYFHLCLTLKVSNMIPSSSYVIECQPFFTFTKVYAFFFQICELSFNVTLFFSNLFVYLEHTLYVYVT